MAQFFEAVLPGSPLPPKIQTQSSTDPRFEVREDSRSLAEAEVAAPSHDVWLQLFDQLLQTEPRVRRVMSRIRPLNLSRAFGAMRRSLPSFEMLNPRNLRSSGRATALFASLTLTDLRQSEKLSR